MLKMELDHILWFGLTLANFGRLEDEAAHGRFTSPSCPLSRACRPPRPQFVE
jgi:hypothetical protein